MSLAPEFRIVAWEYPFDALKERAFGVAGMIPAANWCKLMFCETGDAKFLHLFAEIQARMIETGQQVLRENPGAVIR